MSVYSFLWLGFRQRNFYQPLILIKKKTLNLFRWIKSFSKLKILSYNMNMPQQKFNNISNIQNLLSNIYFLKGPEKNIKYKERINSNIFFTISDISFERRKTDLRWQLTFTIFKMLFRNRSNFCYMWIVKHEELICK